MNDQASWAVPSDSAREDLATLLAHAQSQYASHTDWYLRHKDSGIKTLGAVLTAEFALLGVYFSGNLPRPLALIGLFSLAVLAVPLARFALLNCKKSFQASLDHALLSTKTIWAMGIAGKVRVPPYAPHECPAYCDEHLYVDRYLRDARGGTENAMTTTTFVEHNMRNRDSPYYATRTILVLMGAAAVSAGLIGSGAAWLFNPG